MYIPTPSAPSLPSCLNDGNVDEQYDACGRFAKHCGCFAFLFLFIGGAILAPLYVTRLWHNNETLMRNCTVLSAVVVTDENYWGSICYSARWGVRLRESTYTFDDADECMDELDALTVMRTKVIGETYTCYMFDEPKWDRLNTLPRENAMWIFLELGFCCLFLVLLAYVHVNVAVRLRQGVHDRRTRAPPSVPEENELIEPPKYEA